MCGYPSLDFFFNHDVYNNKFKKQREINGEYRN